MEKPQEIKLKYLVKKETKNSSVQNCHTLKVNKKPKNVVFVYKDRTEPVPTAGYRSSLEISVLLECGFNRFSSGSLSYSKL